MTNSNNYKIIDKYNELDMYINEYICPCIPNVRRYLRIRITDELVKLQENIYTAGYTKGNIRKSSLVKCKVNLSILDNTLLIVRKCSYIKKHNFEVAVKLLNDLKVIIYSWSINEEKR